MTWIDESELEMNDPPRLVWVKVQEAIDLIWRDNPKRHDMQQLVQSIERYGFQEPAKFDIKLHRRGQAVDDEPTGAIKSGNGRIEAVAWMEAQGKDLPRGCATNKAGEWVLPLIVGTDARSGAVAQAYAVDANNLTLAGGDFDGFDMARLWGPEYVDLLSGLDELPVSVDAEMLSALSSLFIPPNLDDLLDEHGEPIPEDFWPVIRVKVSPETNELYESLMDQATANEEGAKFGQLMEAVDASILGGGLS